MTACVRFLSTVLVACFFCLPATGRAAVETMPVSALKPGMKGVTYTVLQGNKIEEIQTEILGVAKNGLGPGLDLIIGKLVDPKTALTGAVHGMSGSPLYIDGKLVGALSRRIMIFEKDGQCGFTPIADMLKVGEKLDEPRKTSLSAFANKTAPSRIPAEADRSLASVRAFFPGQSDGVRVDYFATPLSVTGVNPQVWQRLAVEMGMDSRRFFAVPGGGKAENAKNAALGPDSLVPGQPVAAVFMTGSVNIAGTGTLTWREGNKVLAFGHPMFGFGELEFPMATAEIITTVPSYLMPFKMSNTAQIVGTITQDRSSAIAGTVGPVPKMASYRVERTSNGKPRPVLSGEFVTHPLLSPMLVGAALESGILEHDDISRTFTLRVSGELKLAGHEPLKLGGVYAGEDIDILLALMQILRPVMTVYAQSYEVLRAESLVFKLEIDDKPKLWTIESVRADRSKCEPGDTVGITVELNPLYGERTREHFAVKLPENLKSGRFTVRVSGANSLNSAAWQRGLEAAKNVDEMIRRLNDKRPQDRLYVQVLTSAPGAVVADRDMPSLPPSVRGVMQGGNQSPDGTYLNEKVWLETDKTLPGAVNGRQEVELEFK
jgi:hypothetical protein